MNAITRNNYEEYFILYMDNELSAEERRSVEAFVQLHPDLQDELDLLLQSKLVPDTSIQYAGKEELFFGTSAAITLSNYEEWLTLYIDNELAPDHRSMVEQFVAQHTAVAEELYILQQTKLPAEEIAFPDKESLYRREEKTRRIGWWRIAAAAAIVTGIVATVVVISNNKSNSGDNPGIVNSNPDPKKSTPIIDQPQKQNNNTVQQDQIADAPVKNEEPKQQQMIPANDIVKAYPKKDNAVQKKEEIVKKDNDLPKPDQNPNWIADNNDVKLR